MLLDRNINYILKRHQEDLEAVKNIIEELYVNEYETYDQCVQMINMHCGEALRIVGNLIDYNNGYADAKEVDLSNLENQLKLAQMELGTYKIRVGMLEQEIQEVRHIIESSPSNEIVKRAAELLDLFESKMKLLASTQNFERHMKGNVQKENHPRYIHQIDNELLAHQYRESGGLTEEIVKYWQNKSNTKVTYHALRLRLVEMGVWMGHNKDNKGGTNQ